MKKTHYNIFKTVLVFNPSKDNISFPLSLSVSLPHNFQRDIHVSHIRMIREREREERIRRGRTTYSFLFSCFSAVENNLENGYVDLVKKCVKT
jgi:hypothetical protein